MDKVKLWQIGFSNPDLEQKYRQAHLESDTRQTIVTAIIFNIFQILMMRNDYILLELSPEFYSVMTLRILLVFGSILGAMYLTKNTNHKHFDLGVSAYLWTIVGTVIYINSTRADYYLGHILSDYITLLILYFLPKLRLHYLVLPTLVFSLVNWLALRDQLAHIDVLGRTALIGFITINAIGIYNNWSWQRIRRQQYLSQIEREQLNQELMRSANTDSLTGCANRRKGIETLDKEWARFKRYQNPFSVALLDMDFFKRINDQFGHQAGDQVLITFTQIVQQEIRDQDLLCRIGGEEFAIVLPETQLDEAMIIAERVRAKCAATPVRVGDYNIRFSVSIGLTEATEHDVSLDNIYMRADSCLYQAKHAGRNQISTLSQVDATLHNNSVSSRITDCESAD